MYYYSKFYFERCSIHKSCYTLVKEEGQFIDLRLGKYAESKKNIEAGINGKYYIIFSEPRDERIKRYFSHTFEGARGKVITSTESLNIDNKTFGDAKQIGYKDLILIQFSNDMERMVMYFIKDKGNYVEEKRRYFNSWVNGEKLYSQK